MNNDDARFDRLVATLYEMVDATARDNFGYEDSQTR